MRRLLRLAVLLLALPTVPALAADPLPRGTPEAVGMSSERLSRIGAALRAEVERNRLPGAVTAIARRGRLVHFEAIGFLDRERGIPMTTDAIFALASMTKPMAGVAALILLEEGKLALGDPVGRFLPPLGQMRVAVLNDAVASGQGPVETVPARRQMTILDLMRHTSGLTYGGRGTTAVHRMYPASSNWSGDNLSAEQFVERLAGLPLLHQPGTVWDYSLSTDVLGLVVERISGQTLGAFMGERLFRPLGMADTGFSVPPEKRARVARALPIDPDTGRPQSVPARAEGGRFDCGGGCALSTAGDYLRFAQMLLDGGHLGEARILGPRTVATMATDHMTPNIRPGVGDTDPTREGYGFGLTVAVRPETGGQNILGNPGDFAWSGAFGTTFWVDPKDELAVVFMAQAPGLVRQHYRRLINSLVYQAILE
jgi:CubicO group peptidase (beta-lactamase class C family)